jgi:hypothetical protein
MNVLIRLSSVALVLALATAAGAEDPLFVDKEKSPGKVFDAASGSPATTPQRIESLEKLQTMLDEMGLDPAAPSDGEIALQLRLTKWTFPCFLKLSDDGRTVAMSLILQGKRGEALDSGRLLALLNANSQVRPVVFAYNDQRKRMELQLGVPNENVGPAILEDALKLLVRSAANTSSIWDVPQPSDSAEPQQSSLVGNWSAARGKNEAFAIALKTDGTFDLVYVKNKSTSKSNGKYTLKEGKLTLITAAGRQEAAITNVTAGSFEFQSSAKADKLTFKKAS